VLREPIERLEALEGEAGVAETERWRPPAVRNQSEREKLAREIELQQAARRRARDSD
jgi:hypothetical protein